MVSQSRVIGGSNAVPNSWPWQILLKTDGRRMCGGSIISPYWVVTASHCVNDPRSGRTNSASRISVVVGEHSSYSRDQYEKEYRASQVIAHPGFSFRHMQNDVALIRLSSPIAFNKGAQPICLPSAPARVGQGCYITGWGRANRNIQSMHHTLQQAKMPVVDQRTCGYYMRHIAPFPIGASSLCSGYGGGRISGCQGDSGGPFVCHNGRNWELHGAVSWGSQNCSNRRNEYTVYANIYNLKSWISSKTGVY